MKFKTIEWKKDRVRLLDQRKLPNKVCYLDCCDSSAVARAICSMAVRGAPAIGVSAAMGIALAAKKMIDPPARYLPPEDGESLPGDEGDPSTAVNLFWAVDRMKKILDQWSFLEVEAIAERLEEEALRICREDVEINRRNRGEKGKVLIREGAGVLTHCNAGALATAGYGTAVGVIQAAWDDGKRFHVFADETRPLLQGARLTAWELVQAGIPVTVLTDNMAGWLMKKGTVSLVVVGADRIARNGDTTNKIGTYGLAVLAKWHRVPFYVAAPTSTLDLSLDSGKDIPIEERTPDEVTHFQGKRVASKGVHAFNPAFDVTPHTLIEAIITEKGVLRKPFDKSLKRIMQ